MVAPSCHPAGASPTEVFCNYRLRRGTRSLSNLEPATASCHFRSCATLENWLRMASVRLARAGPTTWGYLMASARRGRANRILFAGAYRGRNGTRSRSRVSASERVDTMACFFIRPTRAGWAACSSKLSPRRNKSGTSPTEVFCSQYSRIGQRKLEAMLEPAPSCHPAGANNFAAKTKPATEGDSVAGSA